MARSILEYDMILTGTETVDENQVNIEITEQFGIEVDVVNQILLNQSIWIVDSK